MGGHHIAAMPSAFAGPVPVTVTTFGKFLLVEATFSWRGTKQDTKYEGEEERKEGRKGARSLRPRGSLHDLALSQVSRRTDCHSQPVFTALVAPPYRGLQICDIGKRSWTRL